MSYPELKPHEDVRIEPADEPLTVLVCEPSGVQRQILTQRLEDQGYDVVCAASGTDALKIVSAGLCDIMISGVELSDFSGFELCWRIKADPAAAHVHTIVLSSNGDLARLTEALDCGADDFLRKPLVPAEFRARLRAASRIVRLQRRLLHEASNDALTGAMNRRSILRRLDRELTSVSQQARPLHIAMIDLDRFKSINDTYGHAAGDAVLVQLASLAELFVQEDEYFGRLGGEEFLLLMPGADAAKAAERSEAFRTRIAGTPVPIPDGAPLSVTASLGLAGFQSPAKPLSASQLLDRADAALYQAKQAGRNQVCAA